MMRTAAVSLLIVLAALPAGAQVSGQLFEDRDADGVRDPGEPALAGIPVRLFGRTAGGSPVDLAEPTAADGSFLLSPGDGCYLVSPLDPADWRPTQASIAGLAEGSPGYGLPTGLPRFSKIDRAIDNLAAPFRYSAVGDSIAWNFNFCGYEESFWYSKRLRERLACVSGGSVSLDEAAVKGEHTDDLLVDEGGDLNNAFRLIEAQPDLITISMIGNDLLDVDPGGSASQGETNIAVAEVLDARQNLQEVLSVLLAELPNVDIALNSLYDNETYNCYSGDTTLFHRTWLPIVNRMLRELAWGQSRRVAINEVAAEFAREDQLGACTGFDGLICRDFFGFDDIHPVNDGFELILEKVWEGIGGVALGAQDVSNRTSHDALDYGYLRRVRRLLPTSVDARNGAAVADAAAAYLADDDVGARVSLGAGSEEVRFGGFPDWYDEIEIVRVIAGVRYRTTGGVVADDYYRIEASLDEDYRAPVGHAYTPTDWNFFTPIVGGGGPGAPAENPDYGSARVLVRPDVASFREASAMLGKNPALDPGEGLYRWPAPTHAELATTTVRVAAAPVAGSAGNDSYQVEVDYPWLDLYGWERSRPAEVTNLRLDRGTGQQSLEFDERPGAERYNVYVGTLGALTGSGTYDHGIDARCAVAVTVDGTRRRAALEESTLSGDALYFLVTAHVDDVESPTGFASAGEEIDRSQSSCR